MTYSRRSTDAYAKRGQVLLCEQWAAQHRGKVVTHRQILRELWGPNAEENTHYLRVYMTHLRQKLEHEPHTPRHLKTDAGIGYRLVTE